MNAKKIIAMLPERLFLFLSKKYKTDYKVKKLPAQTLFLVMLETLFSTKSYTLRALATQLNDKGFQKHILKNKEYITIDRTAFHYRLNSVDFNYFREIFEAAKKIYRPHLTNLTKRHSTWIFDSTIVSLSADLLKQCGFQATGKQTKKSIKYTLGYSDMPEIARLYTERKYKGENPALGETILAEKIPPNKIILFDRGLQARKVYDTITNRGNLFISRLNKGYKADIVKETNRQENDTKVTQEKEAYLYERKGHKTSSTYRIIHFRPENPHTQNLDKKKRSQIHRRSVRPKHADKTRDELVKERLEEEIIFVTNIPAKQIPAEEIAEIYKERWQIEVFFKFLKQELHFSHLVNRTENGMKSVLYLTMTYALMILAYKKINGLDGYKYVKMPFMLEAQGERKTILEHILTDYLEQAGLLPSQHF